jgi:hypothetical protein
LNDIDQYSLSNAHLGFDEEVSVHKWLSEVFEPIVVSDDETGDWRD